MGVYIFVEMQIAKHTHTYTHMHTHIIHRYHLQSRGLKLGNVKKKKNLIVIHYDRKLQNRRLRKEKRITEKLAS